jgi:hypothetical protein
MIAAAVSVQMKNGVFIVEGGFEYALESRAHSLSMPREHDYQRPVGPKAGHPGTHSQAEVQETAAHRRSLPHNITARFDPNSGLEISVV